MPSQHKIWQHNGHVFARQGCGKKFNPNNSINRHNKLVWGMPHHRARTTIEEIILNLNVWGDEESMTDICTKYCDNGIRVDLGYFGHFRGTKIVGGRSQVDRLLLELEDWITASWTVDKCLREQEQKQEVTGSMENGRKWLSFSLILLTFT
jgi:hypothetical protein